MQVARFSAEACCSCQQRPVAWADAARTNFTIAANAPPRRAHLGDSCKRSPLPRWRHWSAARAAPWSPGESGEEELSAIDRRGPRTAARATGGRGLQALIGAPARPLTNAPRSTNALPAAPWCWRQHGQSGPAPPRLLLEPPRCQSRSAFGADRSNPRSSRAAKRRPRRCREPSTPRLLLALPSFTVVLMLVWGMDCLSATRCGLTAGSGAICAAIAGSRCAADCGKWRESLSSSIRSLQIRGWLLHLQGMRFSLGAALGQRLSPDKSWARRGPVSQLPHH